jgi:hypothetical protein
MAVFPPVFSMQLTAVNDNAKDQLLNQIDFKLYLILSIFAALMAG